MKLSVIILNWNGKELMRRFLPSVLAHTPPETAEIVVADNGSSDGSVDMLRAEFPAVRLVVLDRNYGFAEGYNRAIEHTSADYTVLLNSDVEVTPGWLEAPLSLLDSDQTVAAIQPKILSQRQKQYFEYAGAAGGFLDRYGYPYCRGRVMSAVEEDRGQYDSPVDVLWATGACLFIRTAVYRKEGGLDARFFAHQEEIDLCWRLRARGYRIVCEPRSVVYHVGGGTLGHESPHKTYLNFRNNLLMVYKNTPAADLGKVLRLRRLLDYMAAAKFLLTGHAANAAAVARARREFRLLRKIYGKAREYNLQRTVCRDIPEIRRQSLLASFYLKGARTFDRL